DESAAELDEDCESAISRHSGQRAARDLDEQNGSVSHRHADFGNAKAARNNLGLAKAAHSDCDRGGLRKSAALKPSGAAISTIGSSRASYSMRSARVITACMS